jgi:predicted nicotinamide N-methyase
MDLAEVHSYVLSQLPPKLAERLPLETVSVPIGGRIWRIITVQNQDELLAVADQLEHIPYGYLLWESAIGLAQLLLEHYPVLTGKRILELGCGVGLPGLVAAHLGADVWQTDHEQNALMLATVNARQNGVTNLQQFAADWRTWAHSVRYDLLLGADILYERAMHPFLETIFWQNLAPQGRLLLSDPSRPQALDFVAAMEKRGWCFEIDMQTITLPTDDPQRRQVNVALLTGVREGE